MNVAHITGNTVVALPELADQEYLAYALRGTSLGGALVKVQYSPDSGSSWADLEGHSTADATDPLALGSCRGPVYWPAAMLRLSVTGGTGVDFTLDYAVGML